MSAVHDHTPPPPPPLGNASPILVPGSATAQLLHVLHDRLQPAQGFPAAFGPASAAYPVPQPVIVIDQYLGQVRLHRFLERDVPQSQLTIRPGDDEYFVLVPQPLDRDEVLEQLQVAAPDQQIVGEMIVQLVRLAAYHLLRQLRLTVLERQLRGFGPAFDQQCDQLVPIGSREHGPMERRVEELVVPGVYVRATVQQVVNPVEVPVLDRLEQHGAVGSVVFY
uniref:Uncharacterized protein n=1 Tax=Anopheles farauti TaxID=69004 RepID=A0A182QEC0_9DIPT